MMCVGMGPIMGGKTGRRGKKYVKQPTNTWRLMSPAEAGLLCVVTFVTNEEVNVRYT